MDHLLPYQLFEGVSITRKKHKLYDYFLIMVDGKESGFIEAYKHPHGRHGFGDTVEILSMELDEKLRGKGYGSEALKKFAELFTRYDIIADCVSQESFFAFVRALGKPDYFGNYAREFKTYDEAKEWLPLKAPYDKEGNMVGSSDSSVSVRYSAKVSESLDERAIAPDEIPYRNVGLVRHEEKRGLHAIALILYDFDRDQAIGFAETLSYPDQPTEVHRTSAERGYGPMMHDFILMDFYPDGLIPERESISKLELGVWRYYFNNRDDVKKEPIRKGEPGYAESYAGPHSTDKTHHSRSDLKIINTIYYLEPSEAFRKLLKDGETLMERHDLKPRSIFVAGDALFYDKYKKIAA